jgi:dTDP-4-dehydrorhamnose reductase
MLVNFSTGYVFDGTKATPYTEIDEPKPQSVYGASKLAGDRGVEQACVRHLILRTSWVLDAHGRNFSKAMLRLAAERDTLNVVADQWASPTSAAMLADITAHLIIQAQQRQQDFPYGLYHMAAAGETNWHAYATYVIDRARKAGRTIRVTPNAVRGITTSDYPTPAKRPANSRLDISKLRKTFKLHIPDWQSGVDHILDQIL